MLGLFRVNAGPLELAFLVRVGFAETVLVQRCFALHQSSYALASARLIRPWYVLESKVTRKGQVTNPAILRKKYGIREGTKMNITDSSGGILLKPIPDFRDLAGVDAGKYTHSQMTQRLNRLRQRCGRSQYMTATKKARGPETVVKRSCSTEGLLKIVVGKEAGTAATYP